MTKKKMGLLIMAYGTPYQQEDILPYYTHIRHGRKPTDEQLQDLIKRYNAIGGVSPLAKITQSQAEGLTQYLNERQDDYEFKLYIGLKHIAPFIEDAVKQMHDDGIDEAVSLVLAPHFSTFSVKAYNNRAKETAEELGGPIIYSIKSWYKEPKFIDYWVKQLEQTFTHMPEEHQKKAVVIFSAHSLPEKIIAAGDPYPKQLEETAELIAKSAGIEDYAIGWQSAGNTPDPWIGPDVQDLTRILFKEKGYHTFVYCPVGFVADHLEVLYDNDYECKVVTDDIEANYYRPQMPNDTPEFIDCLATVVMKELNQKGV